MITMSRRALLGLAAAAGAAVTTSCTGVAGGGGGGGAGGQTAIRYAYWGNNVRQQNYTKAFKLFAEDHSDIKIAAEFADYSPYQERMTTQMAARNVADMFWVPSPNVLTYYSSGLYRQIDDLEGLDLADYSEADLESFKIDGKLNTMPFAMTTPVVRFNETFAEADGVDLPGDDEAWTWDEMAEFAVDYAKENSEKRKAFGYTPEHDLNFEYWIRQHGEDLWTEDGGLGCTTDTLAGWMDWWEKLRKAGATTSLSEQDGVAPDWELVGDKVLITWGSSNHLIDDAAMFPDHSFKLRRPPSLDDAPEDSPFLYTPRMAIYADIDEAKLPAAAEILNFCTGNLEMIKTVGLTMGVPVHPRVAEEMVEFADPAEKECLRMVTLVREGKRRPRYEAPAGSSTWREVMQREAERMVLNKVSPKKTADTIINEIKAGLDRAK